MDESVPLKVALIVGSLRRASTNRIVASTAIELLPTAVATAEVAIGDVPFFDQDLEDAGDPPPVIELKTAVSDADALLIVTPEYNGSMPAVVKNAIDWLSRPYGSGPIAGMPTLIVAATPGRHGATNVQAALAASASVAGAAVHATHGVASVTRAIENDRLVDPDARASLAAALDDFVAAVRSGEVGETSAP